MRIISGLYRSRRIEAPEGLQTRPTPEKTREAVFSMLQASIPEARVLDLFAGSGAMGLEALSRGASFSVFIDNSPAAQKAIVHNIQALDAGKSARLLGVDFHNALASLRGAGEAFDLVFMDPPYSQAQSMAKEALLLLREYGILAQGALICIEHAGGFQPPPGFASVKDRRYGRAHIAILREAADA